VTEQDREYVIHAENRVLAIVAEDREHDVPIQDRNLGV